MIINFLDIPGLWNLTWIVPLAVVTGIGLYSIFGGGKSRNPEGPPYTDFDEQLDMHTSRRGIEPIGEDHDFDVDWSPIIRGHLFGEPKHGRTFGPDSEIPKDFGDEWRMG